jgi:hypothetical protein
MVFFADPSARSKKIVELNVKRNIFGQLRYELLMASVLRSRGWFGDSLLCCAELSYPQTLNLVSKRLNDVTSQHRGPP